MPIYDVAAVAEALDFSGKQLDNLLSRNVLLGVEKGRRGLARRMSPELAVTIQLAVVLSKAFRISPGSVLQFAQEIERGNADQIAIGKFLTLHVDLPGLRTSTLARLDKAVEAVGRRPRGRPPKRSRPAEIGM